MKLIRKPDQLDAFNFNQPSVIMEAYSYFLANGWRGRIEADESGVLHIELNADNPTRQIIASIGDIIVDDSGWRKITQSEFESNYDVV